MGMGVMVMGGFTGATIDLGPTCCTDGGRSKGVGSNGLI